MKKFMYLYVGWGEPTPEVKKAWGDWFAAVGDQSMRGSTLSGRALAWADQLTQAQTLPREPAGTPGQATAVERAGERALAPARPDARVSAWPPGVGAAGAGSPGASRAVATPSAATRRVALVKRRAG